MRIKKSNDLALVISDLNGRILHVNHEMNIKIRSLKAGDSISKIVDLDYVRKITMFDNIITVVKPIISIFTRAVIRVIGKGTGKTLEIYFFDNPQFNDESLINEVKLLSSYSEIVSNQTKKSVKIDELLRQLVQTMKDDIRLAYRKFEIEECDISPELYVNFAHLCTIITGAVIVVNEIEYKNPIRLSLEKDFDQWVIKISVTTSGINEKASGIYGASLSYPRLAMKLTYIESLCRENEMDFSFVVESSSVTSCIGISSLLSENDTFRFDPFNLDASAYIKRAIEIFLPEISDTEEAGQE